MTRKRYGQGADEAFNAVLDCLDVLDRHTLPTDTRKRETTSNLRRVVKQMRDET